MREEENAQYQADVEQLTKTEELIGKAMKLLKDYYSKLDEKSGVAAVLVQSQEDPAPPSTWKGAYSGQKEEGAVGMLETLLDDTKKQHEQADMGEAKAVEEFTQSMEEFKNEQKEQARNMLKIKKALATAQEELINQKQTLKQLDKDEQAAKSYQADLKKDCTFIFDNFDLRNKNRGLEK